MAKKLAKKTTVKPKPAPAAPVPKPAAVQPSAPPDLAPPSEDVTSALQLIKEFEGCVLHSYWDATGKCWTIGYGTTVYPDGKNVQKQQTCTRAQAVAWLEHDIQTIRLPAIEKMVTVPITNAELCALVSFCYNVGVGGPNDPKKKGFYWSSIRRNLNAKQPKIRVADGFLAYIKSGGRVLPGLVRRRKAERELFLTEPIGEIVHA